MDEGQNFQGAPQQPTQVVYVTPPKEENPKDKPMTVGSWLWTLFLINIPIVGFICCICWMFGAGNRSRTAFVRAYAVIYIIEIVVFLLFSAQILAFITNLLSLISL